MLTSMRGGKIWVGAFAGIVALLVLIAAVLQPEPVQNAEHFLRYRLTGYLPPPIVQGRNGRIFLGNHAGSAPGSLIADVCGNGVDPAAIGRAVATLQPVLAAGRATGLPFRLLIVPTAPRLYPEDVPESIPCNAWPADRLVAALHDPAIVYPVAEMAALKARFDVLPRRHFHWAGEGPLRTAEIVARSLSLEQDVTLPLRGDNRSSDLNGFYKGAAIHDRIGTPNLKAAGVALCWSTRCSPAVPNSVVTYTRPGPGRILLLADSFGDEIGGDFSEFAGQVWLVRMNVAVQDDPAALAAALHDYAPTAVIVVYHDAGALALDVSSQTSLALVARLLSQASLPPAAIAH